MVNLNVPRICRNSFTVHLCHFKFRHLTQHGEIGKNLPLVKISHYMVQEFGSSPILHFVQ